MRYSHSRIETYKSCPKKFYFQYIEKPDIEEKKGIEAFLGSMVHLALEKLYKDLKFTKLNSLEEILEYYSEEWEKNFDLTIEIVRLDYTAEHYKEMGKRFLTDYYEKYHPFDSGKTLGLEMEITLRFIDDYGTPFDLIGYIDRLTMINEEHFEIHDYKTNNSLKTQEEVDKDKQLALYTIAIKKMYPTVKRVDLVWHFLAFNIELRSSRSDKDLEELEKEVVKAIQEIERKQITNDFPTKESALCDWCAFKEICPVKSHSFKLSKLPVNEYLNDDGVKLVEEYLKLTKEKKEVLDKLDPELEKLKEALVAYSKTNNSERVYGPEGNSILVKEYENYSLPEKDSRQRQDFEKLLKESGTWEMIAEVNSFNFSKAVTSGLFSKDFLKRLEPLISKGKTTRLYPSSKK
ncbi:MAG TPA: PD-(D/E)XK nuclease family protein [archaeon]|nr:PD-(D/E)XK nuclease family protein [archaeon]